MLIFGIGVLLEAGLKLHAEVLPGVSTMAGVGALGFVANTYCFVVRRESRAELGRVHRASFEGAG